MIQEVSVYVKPSLQDAKAVGVLNDIREFLHITSVEQVKPVKKYLLEGVSKEEAETLARKLFYEEVWQECQVNDKAFRDAQHEAEVAYKPGVMNPEAASILHAVRDLGYTNLAAVSTSWQYFFYGQNIRKEEIDMIVGKLLMNKTIEQILVEKPQTLLISGQRPKTASLPIRGMDQEQLMKLSKEALFLNEEEMKTIQDYFQELGRDSTDCELEMLAQTWSEHCVHKTFNAKLIIDGKEKDPLMTRLKRATKETDRDDIISAFEDNSGVIDFYDGYAICGKVETHNSPSAIEPYGGAATGSGGVFRDIMGTGLGAKAVLSTDIFCVAPPNISQQEIPKGCLHPRYLLRKIVAGVRDYGNRMGIPTSNGSVHFHKDFVAKPSVIVGAYGLIKKNIAQKGEPKPQDAIFLIGGRTGRDGIHGATFSSGEMTESTELVHASAVQIGNAIEEKRMFDACLKLAEKGYVRAITDCGAGGLSSAVGEMGKHTGARVYLEKCPLKYTGLAPWEIWLSESQERMVLAIPPEHIDKVQKVCKRLNVEGTVIGEFTEDQMLHLTYEDEEACNLAMEFIHEGLPQRTMTGTTKTPSFQEPDIPLKEDLTEDLVQALSHLNVCSKEPIIHQYDHTVQGGAVLYSLSGKTHTSPSDATVTEIVLGSNRGLAVAHGLNPILNRIDPYYGSLWAILEAVSNMVAAGVNPRHIALIDNFIWPFPDEESLADLDKAVDAIVHASKILNMPFVSGKDSLSSTYRSEGKILKIPPVLCISAFSKVEDVRKVISSCFKKSGNVIVLVGNTKEELAGSVYYDNHNQIGNNVPKPDLAESNKIFQAVHKSMAANLVLACHDISEGGLGSALSEMCFGNQLGAKVKLEKIPHNASEMRPDALLFSESSNKFLMEVAKEDIEKIKDIFGNLPFGEIGEITADPKLELTYNGKIVIGADTQELLHAWQKPMKDVFAD